MQQRRRFILAALWALLFLASAPAPLWAKDADAGAFLESLNREAHAKLADLELSQEQREANFRAMFRTAFDIPAISRFVLGRYWREASDDQRQSFMELFEELNMRRFLPYFADVSDKAIAVKRVQPEDARPNLFRVSSVINRPEGEPIAVVWRIRDNGGDYKVLDIVAEGVSMAISLRQEYGTVAKTEGVDGLLAMMRKKTAELAGQ